MTIGMIVAMRQELESFLAGAGESLGTERIAGYEINQYRIGDNRIYVVESGVGEISAAAGTQLLITKYAVDMIVNFGVVGGLTADMSLSDVVFVERVVHYDFDASPFFVDRVPAQYPGYESVYIPADEKVLERACTAFPQLHKVTCASADKFVDGAEAKRALHEQFDADICDMESAGILLTCRRCGVPAIFIKAVSDNAEGGAEQFEAMIDNAARVCVSVVQEFVNSLNV
jgi:adenosylhomocysteine nucleosidase